MTTLTPSEEIVYRVCKHSFLSLWTYANPRKPNSNKELCDILVVCEPDVVIFSVKDIKLKSAGDPTTNVSRWHREAIEASVKQVYGAERALKTARHVTKHDGSKGLALNENLAWRYHRVAVAAGGEGKTGVQYGDFGKGFVHVFDELSFSAVLGELDTVIDFVDYLRAKEEQYATGVTTLFEGAEEDLLALYLQQGRSFSKQTDLLVVDNGLWEALLKRPEYQRKRIDDRESYVWDKLIEGLCDSKPGLNAEPGPSFTEQDIAVRVMARERRLSRRALGVRVKGFLLDAKAKKTEARIIQSFTSSDVAYVLLSLPHGTDGQYMQAALGIRCLVARGLCKGCTRVVGIAFEDWEPGGAHSTIAYIEQPAWTDKDEAWLVETQAQFGYFTSPIHWRVSGDEYPATDADMMRQVPVEPSDGRGFRLLRNAGRNDPCPCGSGKKFKRCHGK